MPSTRRPWLLVLLPTLAAVASSGCEVGAETPTEASEESSTGDETEDPSGDGDGDSSEDGDGDPATGDGDGDPATGDGDPATGDGDGDSSDPPGCNGHLELCDRRYDQVVFPGTHNSHAATMAGFSGFVANQVYGIPDQLEDGVRVLLIDTYYDEADPGVILLCHGPCNLGSTPHLEALGNIVSFLTRHPSEVVTIIYQDGVAAADLAVDYGATGASELVYTHTPGQVWPTLGQMVAANTRLVVSAEQGGPPPAWHHHVWDLAWDTPYGPEDPADLSCELNRGSPDNDLFLVNHWVNNEIGLPSFEAAETVNGYEFLLDRAEACQDLWDHPANFLVVDYYDRGELFEVVDTLNGF
jgi:hypothetical protein